MNEKWLSTYTGLTAESMLQKIGVEFKYPVLVEQLNLTQSFYKHILRLPAIHAFNDLIREQCRDAQAFSQQKVIDYIFSGEMEKDESEPGADLRREIEEGRQYLVKVGEQLTATEKRHYENSDKIHKQLLEVYKQWQELVAKYVQNIAQKISMDDAQKGRLTDLIDQQAAGVEIDSQIMKSFKVKDDSQVLVKAIIQAFIESNGDISDKQTKKEIKSLAELEDDLRQEKGELLNFIQTFCQELALFGDEFSKLRAEFVDIRAQINQLLEQYKAGAYNAEEDVFEDNIFMDTSISLSN